MRRSVARRGRSDDDERSGASESARDTVEAVRLNVCHWAVNGKKVPEVDPQLHLMTRLCHRDGVHDVDLSLKVGGIEAVGEDPIRCAQDELISTLRGRESGVE